MRDEARIQFNASRPFTRHDRGRLLRGERTTPSTRWRPPGSPPSRGRLQSRPLSRSAVGRPPKWSYVRAARPAASWSMPCSFAPSFAGQIMAAARDHGQESARGAPYLSRPTVSGSRSGRSVEPCRRHGTRLSRLSSTGETRPFDPRRRSGASPRASLPPRLRTPKAGARRGPPGYRGTRPTPSRMDRSFAAGLSHPGDTCTEATMYRFTQEGETKKRTLNAGDIAGIQALY